MERTTGAILEGLELVETAASKSRLAIKQPRNESTKALLVTLLELAEARGEGLSEARMRIYLRDLAECDFRDVQVAARQIGREERGQYEPKFPELGTLLARTRRAREERLRPAKYVSCGVCNSDGFVYVDGAGQPCDPADTDRRAVRECECKLQWRAAKREALKAA